MPDRNGKLSEGEIAQFRRWLEEKWGRERPCPVSGHTEWSIGDVIVQTLAYIPGDIPIGGPTYPLVVVICNGCGYTAFVNAIRAGIVPPTPTPMPEPTPAAPSAPPRPPD